MPQVDPHDAFALFDKKGQNTIPRSSIGDILRACGQNPTLAEISDIEAVLPAELSYDAFQKVLNRPDGFKPKGDVEDFVRGFQVFDKEGSGYISVGELRYVLMNLGEKLTNDEMDDLLKGVDVGKQGDVNYTDFVRMILSN